MTSHPVIYVDTSALGALLIDQPESPALLDWLDQTPATLVSSDLLETEAAMRLDASEILTYDRRLGEAARSAGLDVVAPGATDAR